MTMSRFLLSTFKCVGFQETFPVLLKNFNATKKLRPVLLVGPTRSSRFMSTDAKKSSSLAHSNDEGRGEVSTSVAETVKETTKTVSYLGVIIAGVGVTAIMFYAVFSELFSSKSPNSVYSKALDRCLQDTRLVDSLGEPVKGHGETTRRGRRRHTNHIEYEKDGVKHLRMIFYLKGSRNSGTVHLEVKENESGNYEYRYLFVELDDFSRRVIILEDNRGQADMKTPLTPDLGPLNLQ